MDPKIWNFFLALLAPAMLSSAAVPPSYKVESAGIAAPQELAAPVRAALSSQALRISGAQGVYCEIWLRHPIPQAATPNGVLGIAFGQIADGTLVGAVRFAALAKDYRQQEVKPGVYTLRYALQPVDGDHQGVSAYRDFLLLVPATADSSTDPLAFKNLVNLSRKASGVGHPSVWSLLPADNAPSALPAVIHVEDGDLWVLYFTAAIGSAPIAMGLVISGHAPEA